VTSANKESRNVEKLIAEGILIGDERFADTLRVPVRLPGRLQELKQVLAAAALGLPVERQIASTGVEDQRAICGFSGLDVENGAAKTAPQRGFKRDLDYSVYLTLLYRARQSGR
jgi:hypothetical protein